MTNSQHRHRVSVHHNVEKSRLQDPGRPYLVNGDETLALDWKDYLRHELYSGFSLDSYAVGRRLVQNSRLRWGLALYCSFCLVFLSSGILSRLVADAAASSPQTEIGTPNEITVSPLHALSLDHLMSKVTSLTVDRHALHTYTLEPYSEPSLSDITACLWTDIGDVDSIPSWLFRWNGPLSLLVTVRAETLEMPALARRFSTLQKSNSSSLSVSIHVLRLRPDAPNNPNAFLNMARLLARTSTVALFPGNLTVAPPKTFTRNLLSKPSSRPAVYTTRGRSTFPFSPLSPLVMSRDDPVWCNERFFPYISRSVDWQECLWQVWLANYGDVEVRQTTDWVSEAVPVTTANMRNPQNLVRRRLSAKFRAETCILATRQLAALRTEEHGIDTRKARWLKRNCRQWTTGPGS